MADFVYYVACCIILAIVLVKKIGAFEIGYILKNTLKVLGASIIASIVGYLLMQVIDLGSTNMLNGFIQLAICGGVSLIVVFGLCWLFKVPEIKKIILKLSGKFRKQKG